MNIMQTSLLYFQAQIDVQPFDYPIDPVAVPLGGQVCLDLNVTVPCEFNICLIIYFNIFILNVSISVSTVFCEFYICLVFHFNIFILNVSI